METADSLVEAYKASDDRVRALKRARDDADTKLVEECKRRREAARAVEKAIEITVHVKKAAFAAPPREAERPFHIGITIKTDGKKDEHDAAIDPFATLAEALRFAGSAESCRHWKPTDTTVCEYAIYDARYEPARTVAYGRYVAAR